MTRDERHTRAAGRLYLTLAIVGEMFMLAGFMLVAAGFEGLLPGVCLYIGMGVKHAVLPLHVWLPRAHGTAPTPASALLSSTLLKAGLLGWLRFMPPAGGPALESLAVPVLVLGLAAAFYGALCGTLQNKPKMLLGYSSVSQMGLATAVFAVAAAHPDSWASTVPVLLLFILHHALTKAALFLGVGVSRRRAGGDLVLPVSVLLSLALAGLPGLGGYVAKAWLETELHYLPANWAGLAHALLPLTSVATTVLMARFLWLMRVEPAEKKGVGERHVTPGPFLALSLLALPMPWVLLYWLYPQSLELFDAGMFKWKALWPLLIGGGLALVGVVLAMRGARLPWLMPPGDVAVPIERCLARLKYKRPTLPVRPVLLSLRRLPSPDRVETVLRRFSFLGVCYLLLLILFALSAGYPFGR